MLSTQLARCSSVVLALVIIFSRIHTNSGSQDSLSNAQKILRLSDSTMSQNEGSEIPFTTISFAQTIDGSIAPSNRTRMNISSKTSFRLLHSLRARHQAILIGINTVLYDQPQLNVRDPLPGVAISNIDPRPVVLDSNLRITDLIGKSFKLRRPIICTCVSENDSRWSEALEKLKGVEGEIVSCRQDMNGRCDMNDVIRLLKRRFGISTLLVEGGASIIHDVLQKQLVSQVVMAIKPCFLGGYRLLPSQLPELSCVQNMTTVLIDGDIIIHGILNHKGSCTLMETLTIAP